MGTSIFVYVMAGFIALALIALTLFLVRDVLRHLSGSGGILALGLALLFIGERWAGEGTARTATSLLGVAIIVASIAFRVFALGRSTEARKAAHQQALYWTLCAVGGATVYGLSLPSVTEALGFVGDASERWSGSLQALCPILVVLGLLPVFALDRLLGLHPVKLPRGSVAHAWQGGASAALALALMVPVNYLADAQDKTWNVAYFQTTRVGESTLNIAGTLTEPMNVYLFYPPGNDVRAEIEPYFSALEASSNGLVVVQAMDQAMQPELSEELQIRDNGFIVLAQGDNTQKFKVDVDFKKAKRELRKLDSTVRKHLIKLTRGQRKIYWLAGHGEASWSEKDDPLRKLSILKRSIFEPENLKVEDFSVATGSTDEVPDDAALVVVAAPQKALFPEEVDAITQYADRGGKVLVMLEPDGDPATDLLAHLGAETGPGVLANADKHLRQSGGLTDRVLLASNKFGAHESVKTLSRNSAQTGVVFPTARWIGKKADGDTRVSALVRTFPDTWADLDANLQPGEGEEKRTYDVAVAVTKAESDLRAVIVGDVNMVSDPVLQAAQGNATFVRDILLWLLEEEASAGEVESEEDVAIVQTNEEDKWWFIATVFLVPLSILGLGFISIRLRRRNG